MSHVYSLFCFEILAWCNRRDLGKVTDYSGFEVFWQVAYQLPGLHFRVTWQQTFEPFAGYPDITGYPCPGLPRNIIVSLIFSYPGLPGNSTALRFTPGLYLVYLLVTYQLQCFSHSQLFTACPRIARHFQQNCTNFGSRLPEISQASVTLMIQKENDSLRGVLIWILITICSWNWFFSLFWGYLTIVLFSLFQFFRNIKVQKASFNNCALIFKDAMLPLDFSLDIIFHSPIVVLTMILLPHTLNQYVK